MHFNRNKGYRYSAFTLTELIIAVVLISLFLLLAVPNLYGLLRKSTFKAQIQDFVSTMQMADTAAAESSSRYEVIIDMDEQRYLLREITSNNLAQVLEDEIIVENDFGSNCWASYVMFDDGDYTNEGRAMFRAGHAGWQYGGKIVLLDEADQPYSVVVNRIKGIVELQQGDVELLLPKAEEDVPF